MIPEGVSPLASMIWDKVWIYSALHIGIEDEYSKRIANRCAELIDAGLDVRSTFKVAAEAVSQITSGALGDGWGTGHHSTGPDAS